MVDHTWQGTVAVPFDTKELEQIGQSDHPPDPFTNCQNSTDLEANTKAFDARRALWQEEDAREEEQLRAVGKPLTDALLNTVPVQGDLQQEDQAV